MILEQVITKYCSFNHVKTEDILKRDQHELYHKRIKTESCCICFKRTYTSYTKVIPEKQWELLYEKNEGSKMHSCPCKFKDCCEDFVPKKINTCDLLVAIPLIFYSKEMLQYIVNILRVNGLKEFLSNNQHALYHCMEKKRCCMCHDMFKVHCENPLLYKEEWTKLFKKQYNTPCSYGNTECCCMYSVNKDIEFTDMNDISWSKLFHVAGPISHLRNIEHNTFLNFLSWTLDDQPLRGALIDLLFMIEDEKFRSGMLQRIKPSSDLNEAVANNVDVNGWISKHLQHQKVRIYCLSCKMSHNKVIDIFLFVVAFFCLHDSITIKQNEQLSNLKKNVS